MGANQVMGRLQFMEEKTLSRYLETDNWWHRHPTRWAAFGNTGICVDTIYTQIPIYLICLPIRFHKKAIRIVVKTCKNAYFNLSQKEMTYDMTETGTAGFS